jgi:nitroreductase
MITVLDAIKQRRSIRKFKPDPVPDEILLELINCARLAPSSHNCQMSRFALIKDVGIKNELCGYSFGLSFIAKAPCVIVCCADLSVFSREHDPIRLEELEEAGANSIIQNPNLKAHHFEKDLTYKISKYYSTAEVNSAIATEHIVLASLAFGLGTCWVRKMESDKIHNLLNLPDTIMVCSLLPIGYPAQDPPQRPRIPLEDYLLT